MYICTYLCLFTFCACCELCHRKLVYNTIISDRSFTEKKTLFRIRFLGSALKLHTTTNTFDHIYRRIN